MLEQLRIELITAFHVYNEKFGEFREGDWDKYCRSRENYLRVYAREHELPYHPLKSLIEKGEDF